MRTIKNNYAKTGYNVQFLSLLTLGGSVQPTTPPTPTGVTTQPNPTGGTIQPTNPNQETTTPTISISTNKPLPGKNVPV